MSLAALKWDGDIREAIPRGFSRLSVPEDVREKLRGPYAEGLTVVIFDQNLDFAQFPIQRVRPDGSVDLGPAVPW